MAGDAGCVPAGQVMATEMHCVASAAPGASVVPVAQGVQLSGDVAPSVGEKVPSGHSMHVEDPALDHEPA